VSGIDPEPKITKQLAPARAYVPPRATSTSPLTTWRAEFGRLACCRLAFIDGMHQFKFALRDFINIEKHCTSRSTILIHDCYPCRVHTAERERRTASGTATYGGSSFSLGNIARPWALKYRTAPTGLGVGAQSRPDSSVLRDNYDAIVGSFWRSTFGPRRRQIGMLALFPTTGRRLKRFIQ